MSDEAHDLLWKSFLAYLQDKETTSVTGLIDSVSFSEWATYHISKWHLDRGRPWPPQAGAWPDDEDGEKR